MVDAQVLREQSAIVSQIHTPVARGTALPPGVLPDAYALSTSRSTAEMTSPKRRRYGELFEATDVPLAVRQSRSNLSPPDGAPKGGSYTAIPAARKKKR